MLGNLSLTMSQLRNLTRSGGIDLSITEQIKSTPPSAAAKLDRMPVRAGTLDSRLCEHSLLRSQMFPLGKHVNITGFSPLSGVSLAQFGTKTANSSSIFCS